MARLSTVAMLVCRMAAMKEFYHEAFGFVFRQVDTFGLAAWFGKSGDVTIKLVPLREDVDFDGFPMHQLGFEVDDVARVIDLAIRCGGRQEGDIMRDGEMRHAAVRDPDGNTIELYSKEAPGAADE